MSNKKNLSKAKKIQYKQWLAANPQVKEISVTPLETDKKPGRNDPCFCKSGKKFKKCCLNKSQKSQANPI